MRLDRLLGPLLIVLSLGWLWLVYLYVPSSNTPGEPGPRSFPIGLGCALLLLGLAISLTDFARRREGDATAAKTDAKPLPLGHELRIVLGTFGALVLYAFLMEKTGFLVSTPVVMVLTMAGLLRMRRWTFIALMASGVTLVCWLVFVFLLRVPLPSGSMWWLL